MAKPPLPEDDDDLADLTDQAVVLSEGSNPSDPPPPGLVERVQFASDEDFDSR